MPIPAARRAVLLLLALAVLAPMLPAQGPAPEPPLPAGLPGDTLVRAGQPGDTLVRPRLPGAPIRWWHAAAAAGGTALLVIAVDDPVRRRVQRSRGTGTDRLADVLRQPGWGPVYLGVPALLTGVGLAAGDDDLARAGGRMLTSVLLAATVTQGTKRVLGRRRPREERGPRAFDLLAFDDAALPSGHTTGAVALAASAAMQVRSPALRVAFYSVAAGTAWSRLNDDEHWLSDVALGGLIGVTSAKLVQGRWRLFRLPPPSLLMAPTGQAALGWNVPF